MAAHLTGLTGQSWYTLGRIPDSFLTRENFDALWALRPEEPQKIVMFGKPIEVPRRHQSFGQDYRFSGATAAGSPTPQILLDIQAHLEQEGWRPTQILVNWYSNGHDYIGSHADDENQLVPGAAIASVSFGATRKFRIRGLDKKILKDQELKNGDVLFMCGAFQQECKHEIVKVAGARGERVGRRINVTYRVFNI